MAFCLAARGHGPGGGLWCASAHPCGTDSGPGTPKHAGGTCTNGRPGYRKLSGGARRYLVWHRLPAWPGLSRSGPLERHPEPVHHLSRPTPALEWPDCSGSGRGQPANGKPEPDKSWSRGCCQPGCAHPDWFCDHVSHDRLHAPANDNASPRCLDTHAARSGRLNTRCCGNADYDATCSCQHEPCRQSYRAEYPVALAGQRPDHCAFHPGDQTRQGIGIAGQSGDKVVAAAAGEVVYSGAACWVTVNWSSSSTPAIFCRPMATIASAW